MTADEFTVAYRAAVLCGDEAEADRLERMITEARTDLAVAADAVLNEMVRKLAPSIRKVTGAMAAREIDRTGDVKSTAAIERLLFNTPDQ